MSNWKGLHPQHEADHLPLSRAKVNNAWIYLFCTLINDPVNGLSNVVLNYQMAVIINVKKMCEEAVMV
jgi:hypothetical protein